MSKIRKEQIEGLTTKDLTDFDDATPTGGQTLTYDAANGLWKPATTMAIQVGEGLITSLPTQTIVPGIAGRYIDLFGVQVGYTHNGTNFSPSFNCFLEYTDGSNPLAIGGISEYKDSDKLYSFRSNGNNNITKGAGIQFRIDNVPTAGNGGLYLIVGYFVSG